MHFHFHVFSGWGTFQGPKLNLKAFFSSSSTYNCSKYFWSNLVSVSKSKIFNSQCIFKSYAEGFNDFFSCYEAVSFCKMACIYLLSSRGGPQCFDFHITCFIPKGMDIKDLVEIRSLTSIFFFKMSLA